MTMIAKPPEDRLARRGLAMLASLAPLCFVAACAQPASEQADQATPREAPSVPAPAAPQDGAESQIPASFRALGTEPFWAVISNGTGTGETATGAGLRYSTPENIDGTQVMIEDETVQPALRRLTGTMDGKSFAIELTVGQCSDGMSDRVYPYTVRLAIEGESLAGCARPLDG